MSRTIRDGILPSAVLIMIGFLLMAGQAMGEQKGARIAVEESTNQLLSKLVEIQPLYTENPEQFFQQVGSSLAPFIDFKGFSRGVMAKYYRRATDDQKSRFVSVFQDKMIRTYAKALVEFDNQRVEVVESTSTESKPDRAAIDLLVYSNEGAVYTINYSMVLVDAQWMLRNVTIEGINIGLQFRSQFAAYMDKYGNSIDDVIDNWSVDV
ncbi:MAG: phospholipid transport system substrate-binding protein [Candidatus Pseudothioglobus sp.]|jgi:phospholipid transport system substrate-binding protein